MTLLKTLLISLLLPAASLALSSYDCPPQNTSIPPIPPLEPTTKAFADSTLNNNILVVVEVDPLREDGEEFARKLAAAGVETTVFRAEGTVHDFVMFNGLSKTPAVRGTIELAGLKLKRELA